MAKTYLSLTNEVLNRMNEVELTSSGFTSARGFQIQCKNAVNDAILYINSREFNWPFNHSTTPETLVAGTTRYSFASTVKHVDFDTFRITKDSALSTNGGALTKIDYKDYMDKYVDQEDDATVKGTVPTHVFRTPDNNWGLYPYPDKAYTVKYESYAMNTLLSAFGDEPTIPEQYRTVIIDGATAYAYLYRGEKDQYLLNWERFEDGISQMRVLLINRDDYVRSSMIVRGHRNSTDFMRT
jgi:hypothetical protein